MFITNLKSCMTTTTTHNSSLIHWILTSLISWNLVILQGPNWMPSQEHPMKFFMSYSFLNLFWVWSMMIYYYNIPHFKNGCIEIYVSYCILSQIFQEALMTWLVFKCLFFLILSVMLKKSSWEGIGMLATTKSNS